MLRRNTVPEPPPSGLDVWRITTTQDYNKRFYCGIKRPCDVCTMNNSKPWQNRYKIDSTASCMIQKHHVYREETAQFILTPVHFILLLHSRGNTLKTGLQVSQNNHFHSVFNLTYNWHTSQNCG